MDIMDYAAKLLPHAQKALEKVFRTQAKYMPAPMLPDGAWEGVSEAKSDCFTVGFGRKSFTPSDIHDTVYWLAGYGRDRPAKSIQSNLYASALLIDDNAGAGALLLISLDCVGLLQHDVNIIRSKLSRFCERTGCRQVIVCSTHCHAAPDTMGLWGQFPLSGRNKAYMENLYVACVTAAEQAYIRRKDGSLYAGSAETDGIQKDIRCPEVFCKTLTRLRFVPQDGSAETWILNYAAHPEMMDQRNNAIGADYVHFLREKIETARNARVIYFNGAIGGMITPIEIDRDDFMASVQWAGESIAAAAMSVNNERPLRPVIRNIRQEFYVELANIMFCIGGLIQLMPSTRYATGDGPFGLSSKTEMNYIAIDDVHILTVPGELFPELQIGGYLSEEEASVGGPELNPKPLREIAGDENLIVFGLGCDQLGYILPPNDYLLDDEQPFIKEPRDAHGRKHYEETNSMGPRTALYIANTFERILNIIKNSSR